MEQSLAQIEIAPHDLRKINRQQKEAYPFTLRGLHLVKEAVFLENISHIAVSNCHKPLGNAIKNEVKMEQDGTHYGTENCTTYLYKTVLNLHDQIKNV